MIVPFGDTEDEFTVSFDAESGLLRRLAALRFRAATDTTKTPWFIEPLGWQLFGDVRLPTPAAVTWQDEGRPWLVMTLEDVAYNVDVSGAIRTTGP